MVDQQGSTSRSVEERISMLETIAVSKSFGTRSRSVNAVRDVTMSIVTVSLSQSSAEAAAEKSTLMNLLGALDFPTNGSIFVDREDITQLSAGELVRIRQRKIGFVFQISISFQI